MLQLIMAGVWHGGNPALGGPQGLRIGGGVAGKTTEGALRRQVIQKLAETGTRRQAKRSLELQTIHWRAGMKQGILRVAPALKRRRRHRGSQLQQQGRQIRIHLAVQLQPLGLREAPEAPLAQVQGRQTVSPTPQLAAALTELVAPMQGPQALLIQQGRQAGDR
jgi:hypothetical protein